MIGLNDAQVGVGAPELVELLRMQPEYQPDAASLEKPPHRTGRRRRRAVCLPAKH